MYNAPTLELKTSNPLGCPHNNQSSKLDQEGGNGPKEFWCLSSNFVPGVQFPPNFSVLSSCLVGWPVVWCYTTLLQQWCQPGWKAKCGHSAPTVTPGSCRIFFALFSPVFGHFCLLWLIRIPWAAGGTLVAGMAYRVIRMKKEARRTTKLDEIFQVTFVSKYLRYPLFQNIQGTLCF